MFEFLEACAFGGAIYNRPMTQHYSTLLAAAVAAFACASGSFAAPLAQHAREYQKELATRVMPYWYDTAQDTNRGGYLLADTLKGRGSAREKQLVSQSRMVWGFAHAHLNGYSDANRNYLKAAEQGYHFLVDHFLDKEQGGYFWKTDLAGQPISQLKIVYGQSFVLYGLVEYFRASGDKQALRQALDLYETLQRRAHDAKNGGWGEHFERNWTPLKLRDPRGEVEVAGLKSANTHLHLMEALTELCEASKEPAVRRSLAEAVKLNSTWFYPPQAGQSAFHREPDWSAVTDPRSAGLSYGHNVEFAWLLVRAQKVLGQEPAWAHFEAHLDHALKYGYDHERGGLYSSGRDDQPATNMDKVWWVEAEMMAALTDALLHKQNAAYADALDKLVHFVNAHQADPKDGIWLDTVTADGQPKSPSKAHSWKANYHDVRALVKFIQAFGGPGR
jgi:cellobiose epimerase